MDEESYCPILPVASVPLKEGDKYAKDGEEEEAEDEVEEEGVDQGEAVDGGGDEEEGHDEEEDREPLVLIHLGICDEDLRKIYTKVQVGGDIFSELLNCLTLLSL